MDAYAAPDSQTSWAGNHHRGKEVGAPPGAARPWKKRRKLDVPLAVDAKAGPDQFTMEPLKE